MIVLRPGKCLRNLSCPGRGNAKQTPSLKLPFGNTHKQLLENGQNSARSIEWDSNIPATVWFCPPARTPTYVCKFSAFVVSQQETLGNPYVAHLVIGELPPGACPGHDRVDHDPDRVNVAGRGGAVLVHLGGHVADAAVLQGSSLMTSDLATSGYRQTSSSPLTLGRRKRQPLICWKGGAGSRHLLKHMGGTAEQKER
jgi:hypothetical protein